MKKLIILILAISLTNVMFSNIDTTRYKIVDDQFITNLKDSLEIDSNLVFSIRTFYYTELSESMKDSILSSINNNYFPEFINDVMLSQTGITHNAYDESKRKYYNGMTYISISQALDYSTKVTIFYGNFDYSPKDIERQKKINDESLLEFGY